MRGVIVNGFQTILHVFDEVQIIRLLIIWMGLAVNHVRQLWFMDKNYSY